MQYSSRPSPKGTSLEQGSGRYRVEEKLAAGGMGVVYRAIDRHTNEALALKRMSPEAAADPSFVEAFEREYRVLAGLDHPRIIRVFDYGVDELGPYYTMELLAGRDMRKAGPMPHVEACRLLRDVAASLALLHARRLLHRDISPANVRMTLDGRCKLLDFGALCAFGPVETLVGTAPAIPPEALAGAPLDQRADLYSLGALAYYMLTGRHAYPVKHASELVAAWKRPPPPPSSLDDSIPEELDRLVLSLLSADPLARPATATEVIVRLGSIANLPPEDEGELAQLARSYLMKPRFTGRARELAELERSVEACVRGEGGAVRVAATSGMGRTRLLEEVGLRAQLAGALVLRVDAGMVRSAHGTARALALRLFDAAPELAREHARAHRSALAALGHEVEVRLPPRRSADPGDPGAPLDAWFAAVSRKRPLVVAVDDVEHADDGSLGLLATLASGAGRLPLLVLVTERQERAARAAAGLETLRSHCATVELHGFGAEETLELTRSLFGDAPNVARFADWLHEWTAGSPLHCIEIVRRLVAQDVIRHGTGAGIWILPAERPDAELPAALEDALSMRLARLSGGARRLAQCLCIHRERPTLALVRLLVDDPEGRATDTLLDELARTDVLAPDGDGFRFSSMALRDAILSGMDDPRRRDVHRELGEALSRLSGDHDPALSVQAGYHLIEGGEDLRGADMIAAVAAKNAVFRALTANLHRLGKPLESALRVYSRHRRSVYERMPLVAALAYAGYYEEREWGDRYGDEALDLLDDLSGLRAARRISRFTGRAIGLGLGLLTGLVRFAFVPRRERRYSFFDVLICLFSAVTTMTGTACLLLDVVRAKGLAEMLAPFAWMPRWSTSRVIVELNRALVNIGLEREAETHDAFDALIARLENPRLYALMPPDGRALCLAGAHYARGAMAVFRADGRTALESADALDKSGFKLYAMIASQIRFLYHMNRGEIAEAATHRERVDVHAAHSGSTWQVESWEDPALIPVHATCWDIVAMTRIVDRLETKSVDSPWLAHYARLARFALLAARKEYGVLEAALALLDGHESRSYVGWAATHGFVARALNDLGEHARARALCDRVLADMSDADREYVALFLSVDLEAALADAGLGRFEEAMERVDALLERFRSSEHPIALGLLHEARARIALSAGRRAEYVDDAAAAERWFRRTGNPALIARSERIAALGGAPSTRKSIRSVAFG